MVLQLESQNCSECNKDIKVNRIEPIETVEEMYQVTGMYLSRMNDDYDTENIGFLCDVCATILCDRGEISLGVSGYDLDAMITEKYRLTKRGER